MTVHKISRIFPAWKSICAMKFILAFALLYYAIISYMFYKDVLSVKMNTTVVIHSPMEPLVLPYVIVHLDFKGTPLKLSYLESLLPKLQSYGANGLLMEYEDMFPYEGKLVNLSAEYRYEKTELKRFLTLAKKLGFEIIPLIQTFGHMEHALKLAEFQHLREDPEHPDSICPSKLESGILVKDMITQIIQFHETVSPLKFLHIGCDEVFHINRCPDCLKRALSKSDIFLKHVRKLSKFVKLLRPNLTVLIWDDMMRGIDMKTWTAIENFDNVQPVYWDYASNIQVSHINLFKYHRKFQNIWIASAFKGADGRIAILPILDYRFINIYNWLKYIQDYRFSGEKKVHHFKGIILTGWSRYSHMDPSCELLPATYPILIMNLLLVQQFKIGAMDTTRESGLHSFINLAKSTLDCVIDNSHFDEGTCKFEGQVLYNALQNYSNLIFNWDRKFEDSNEARLGYFNYYSKLGIMNTNMISEHIASLNADLEDLKELERVLTREMKKYYDEDFVTEYVNSKIFYEKNALQDTLDSMTRYSKVKTWSRRTRNSSFFVS